MPLPVITIEQMRAWEEASWRAGRSQAEVIAQAGRAVAQLALNLTRAEDRILILAGKGHNGDDARAAQPHLLGRKVRLLNITDPAGQLPELQNLLQKHPALVVDGLFGIGLSRPLDAAWNRLIGCVNDSGRPVLAVDVPSGLHAATGQPLPTALQARWTLTFGAPKAGLLAAAAAEFVGRLEVASEIGLIPCPFPLPNGLEWVEPADFAEFPPPRSVTGHKGLFGHLAILAGSEGYHGAAVLAARGALRAQPGLVSILCDSRVYLPIASQLQAPMVHPFRSDSALPGNTTCLVAGPGLAAQGLDSMRDFVREQWRSFAGPMLVDASALDWLEQGAFAGSRLRVITPHPGEAARLLGSSAADVQQDRVAALRALSQHFGGCWVVLKGHQTLLGRSEGPSQSPGKGPGEVPIGINSSGNPFLAQGGSGDVLAGFLGGLLAQPDLQAQIEITLRAGVWAHGAAADQLTARGGAWTTEDLPQALAATWNRFSLLTP